MICILLLLGMHCTVAYAQFPWNWKLDSVDTAEIGASIDALRRQFEADKTRERSSADGQNGDASTNTSPLQQSGYSRSDPGGSSVIAQPPFGDRFPPQNVRAEQSDRMVRQCSCEETSRCLDQLKMQALECTENCLYNFNSVTSQSQDLGRCFEEQGDQIGQYMQCFKEQIRERGGCVSTTNGPMIPWQNSTGLLNRELNIHLTSDNPLGKILLGLLKNLLDCTLNFVNCAKQCLSEKTANGICLDQFGCQPLLPTEGNGNMMLNSCTNSFSLKKDGLKMCNCAVNAGVSALKNFCPMIGVIGSGRKSNE